ncbi:MAG: hypothetical protein KGY69_19195 [Bacteroidales bacterium]|nr:hypothetical protein [Bacteroidales bacterium]
MKNNQENKLSMYLGVQNKCNDNKDIWSNMPGFVDTFGRFENLVSKINKQQEIQKGKTTGVTKSKQREEDEMIQATVKTASAVHAFASIIGDDELMSKVNYSPSYLMRLRDTDLRAVCQTIHDAAQSVIDHLADYGKTPEDLDKLQQEIDDFSEMIAEPRSAIGTRATATRQLEELFSEADTLLRDQLDMLMVNYKSSHPRFYNMYTSARMIVDMGKRSRSEEESELDD